MKKTIGSILSQIIPIMIGVYLGFAMNNYGENRKLKKQADTYKKMLTTEITENLEGIEHVREYHIQLKDEFKALSQSEQIVEDFEKVNFKGFRPGFVSNSAYNTGIQTGIIQEFDLKIIQALNKLYTLQGKYSRFNEDMINSFLSNKFPETASEMKSLAISSTMSMNDVLIYEKELIEFYTQLLNKFNGSSPLEKGNNNKG